MEKNNVFERVKTIIANDMELDKNEINLDSSLIDDLGMESVDFVNISAKIEEEFNIEIAEGELWDFGGIFADEGNVKEGRITRQGIKYLRERFPEDDFREVKPKTTITEILSLIKVEFIVNYVCHKTSPAIAR